MASVRYRWHARYGIKRGYDVDWKDPAAGRVSFILAYLLLFFYKRRKSGDPLVERAGYAGKWEIRHLVEKNIQSIGPSPSFVIHSASRRQVNTTSPSGRP